MSLYAPSPSRAASPRMTVIRPGLVCFTLVVALQVLLVFVHSPWRDETQALLIARQPFGRLFGLLHYEGHPALWYLLLKAATTLSDSPVALQVVQAIVAVGFQALLWRYAPFSWPMKLLISVGYFTLFEYGVIARNYGLGVLLFFAFVAYRRTRWSWLLLALMCQTAIHLALLAGVGALILVWIEQRWSWSGAALLLLSGLAALATVTPAADVLPHPAAGRALSAHLTDAILTLSSDIAPVPVGVYPTMWPWRPSPPFDRALGALTLMLGAVVLRHDRRFAGAYLLFCLGLIVVSVAIYPIHVRHAGLIVILLIGLLWIEKDRSGADPDMFARLWLVCLAAGGLWMAGCSLFQPFSYARPLADWIHARNLLDAPWAALPGPIGADLTGQTGRPTFNVQRQCWNTYQRWNYDFGDRPTGAVLGRRLEDFAQAVGPAYLLSDTLLDAGPDIQIKRVATFSGAIFATTDPYPDMYVYKIVPTRFVPRTLPGCP